LIWYSKKGNLVEVENLLVNDVEPTICDSFDHDALYYAQREHKQDVVELLQYWQVFLFIYIIKEKKCTFIIIDVCI
jgi:hypothetical protein